MLYNLNYESDARKLRAVLRIEISSLKKRYSKMSISERIANVIRLGEIVLKQLRCLTIISYFYPWHDKHHEMLEKEYRAFFKRILDIVKRGPSSNRTLRIVFDKLLDSDDLRFRTVDPRDID